MKKFEEPMIKVISFTTEDVITTSGVVEDIDNARVRVADLNSHDFVEDNLFV